MPGNSRISAGLRAGFTLIELLVVIAIVAVLGVAVVLTLNPQDLLRQVRDSTRLSDLAALNKAIGIAQASASGGSLGDPAALYLSIPDTSSSCANLGLPPLAGGMAYRCATAASSTRADGTGWLPVNLAAETSSGISRLPVDPINTYSSDLYYQFQSGPSAWKLTAKLESAKFAAQAGQDGGTDPLRMERGNDLALVAPVGGGAPGTPLLWLAADAITGKSDGDPVTTWSDSSGYGNDAASVGGAPLYRTSRINGKPALEFTAAGDQKMRAFPPVNLPYTAFVVARQRGGANGRVLGAIYPSGANWLLGWWNGYQDTMYAEGFVQPGAVAAGTSWIMYSGRGNGSVASFYKNGSLIAQNALGVQGLNSTVALSGYDASQGHELSNCDIAEVILYGSALSDVDRAAVETYLNAKYALY